MPTIVPRKRKDNSTSYTARIRIKENGKIKFTDNRTFDKRADALRWGVKREDELKEPGAIEREQSKGINVGMLIRRYMHEFGSIDEFGRSKTYDLQRLQKYAIAEIPALKLTSADLIEHVRLRRQEGTGPATVNNDLVWLRVVFKTARPAWGIPLDLLVIDDAFELCRREKLISRPKQRDRRPTLDELNRLLSHFSEGRSKIPMVDIVLFAIFSTRRDSEICRIERQDYNADRKTIKVRNMKDPRKKEGNDMTLHLIDRAVAILERQPVVKGESKFFPYNPKTISANFTRACKILGIKDLRLHDMRHEGISHLFELQMNIPSVAQISGHRTWQNLQRYTHLTELGHIDKYEGWE